MAAKDIRQFSPDDLERMAERGDYTPSRADAPEIELGEEFWRNARMVMPDVNGTTSR